MCTVGSPVAVKRSSHVPDDLPYVWPDPTYPTWPLRRGPGKPITPVVGIRVST